MTWSRGKVELKDGKRVLVRSTSSLSTLQFVNRAAEYRIVVLGSSGREERGDGLVRYEEHRMDGKEACEVCGCVLVCCVVCRASRCGAWRCKWALLWSLS